ncbi:MAG: ABC transporter permease, partial [Gemmatimonadota bacterium]
MQTLAQDVRYGVRSVIRHPAFAGIIVLTLALGIAANATIFGVVNGLILNPFPFPEPDRVVGVGSVHPRLGGSLGFFENLSPAEYLDVREGSRTLEDVVAWDMGNRQIDGEGPPENVFTAFWWGDPLRTVGMRAHLGRGFTDEELRTRAPVALLSYRLWTR